MEIFFENYQHTIEALSVLATFLAVFVSLYIANLSTKTRASAYASIKIFSQDGRFDDNKPHYLTVSITNLGITHLRIPFSFFYFRIPFFKDLLLINQYDAFNVPNIPKKTYPYKVESKQTELFFISELETFREILKSISNNFCGLRLRFMRAYICTDDGLVIKVRMSKEIRKEIINNTKKV